MYTHTPWFSPIPSGFSCDVSSARIVCFDDYGRAKSLAPNTKEQRRYLEHQQRMQEFQMNVSLRQRKRRSNGDNGGAHTDDESVVPVGFGWSAASVGSLASIPEET